MNDLTVFLISLLPVSLADVPRAAGVAGALVYLIVEGLDKLLERFGLDLNSYAKLVLSIVGAIALPIVALLSLEGLHVAHPEPNLWFLVTAAAAWGVSQVAHGGIKANTFVKGGKK